MSSTAPVGLHPVPRRELVVGAAVTAVVAALLRLGPAPADAPAHLYRTFLVQHGALVWDNLWYAGQYPLASYSLLYYFFAAAVGNLPLVVVAAIVSTVLFALIGFHEWGPAARWPIRIFGVLAAAPVFTGLYSYSVGFAALLVVVRAVQRQRLLLAIVFAALTMGFSPLAFVFLCLIMVTALIARRNTTRPQIALVVAFVAVAGVEAAALVLFPSPGVYPFNPVDFAAVLAVCTLGALLARRAPGARAIAVFFVAWAAVSIVSYLLPSAVGDNLTRLRAFVFPLMLVVALQARFRPRLLCGLALAVALAYNLVPYLMQVPYSFDQRPAKAAFWQPAIDFLRSHENANFRVEVVPTAEHWESYWIPRAGYPLARGWYRQLDVTTNPILYTPHLDAAEYKTWLRRMSVKYVLLPKTTLDPDGAPTEARLLRSGIPGVRPAYRSANWTIYELSDPRPLLTGPGAARLTLDGHQTISGTVGAAGTYTLRIHFNPYWKASARITCIHKGPEGMTDLTLRPGPFNLKITPDSLFASLASPSRSTC